MGTLATVTVVARQGQRNEEKGGQRRSQEEEAGSAGGGGGQGDLRGQGQRRQRGDPEEEVTVSKEGEGINGAEEGEEGGRVVRHISIHRGKC